MRTSESDEGSAKANDWREVGRAARKEVVAATGSKRLSRTLAAARPQKATRAVEIFIVSLRLFGCNLEEVFWKVSNTIAAKTTRAERTKGRRTREK